MGFLGGWYSMEMIYGQFIFAMLPGIIVTCHCFSRIIFEHWFLFIASWPYRRLYEKGVRQCFPECGEECCNAVVNLLCTIGMVCLCVVCPIVGVLISMVIVLFGAVLQSCRLLNLTAMALRYKNLCRRFHPSSDPMSTSAPATHHGTVDRHVYHLGMLSEIAEALPSLIFNLDNQLLLDENNLQEFHFMSL